MNKVCFPVLAVVVVLCSSCASGPVGGPTQYAKERSARLGSPTAADQTGEELRFGVLCSGKMCSESYHVNPAGWIPVLGFAAMFPDKPSTLKTFSHKRKYQSLGWLTDYNSPQDSDLIVKLRLVNAGKAESADVISVYSKRSLYHLSGGYVGNAGAMIYDAFKPGTPLYRTVIADRENYLKRSDPSATVT